MTHHENPAGPDPADVREEAERLVAAGLAALSMAADRIGAPTRERGGAAAAGYDAIGDMLFGPASHRRHRVANDSAECCQCPVCRLISAARTPSPVFAERLATGVGTLAEGAARVLRTVAGPGTPAGAPSPPSPQAQESAPAAPDPWAAATTTYLTVIDEPNPAAAPLAGEPTEPTEPAGGPTKTIKPSKASGGAKGTSTAKNPPAPKVTGRKTTGVTDRKATGTSQAAGAARAPKRTTRTPNLRQSSKPADPERGPTLG